MINKIIQTIGGKISDVINVIETTVWYLNREIIDPLNKLKLYNPIITVVNNSFTVQDWTVFSIGEDIEVVSLSWNYFKTKITNIQGNVITTNPLANDSYNLYYINYLTSPTNKSLVRHNPIMVENAIFMYSKYLQIISEMDNTKSYSEGNISESFWSKEDIEHLKDESLLNIGIEINKVYPNMIKQVLFH